MTTTQPVIIEAAINGTTRKEQNPHVPRSMEEIAEDALACIEAGAAIIHNHVDTIGQGAEAAAEAYLQSWMPVFAQRPDALIYPTIDYGANGVSYEHLSCIGSAGYLRLGICDPGSVNLGWVGANGPEGIAYVNDYATIASSLDIHTRHQAGPSLAIYEPGFLRTLLAFQRAGRVPKGAMLKFYFSSDHGLYGMPFGMPPTVQALDMYLDILGDNPMPWAVSIAGGDIVASDVGRAALERGGHLHIGLEFFKGDRLPRNVELVEEAVALCRSVGRPIATPDEAAAILEIPERRLHPRQAPQA